MKNHFLLLKFKEGKKKKQTQGHIAERTLLILLASLRSIYLTSIMTPEKYITYI